MKPNQERSALDLIVFALLVAIGVAGRWAEPLWCFTPIAAVSLLAGYYFSRLPIALMVPVAILAITDLALPAHNSVPVMLFTYAVMTVPVLLGASQRREQPSWLAAVKWALYGIIPATLFFLVSNFAVWAFQSDYEKTLAGLVRCYWAAVPFYRWMVAGDLFYLAILTACWVIAGISISRRQRVEEVVR